MDAGADYLLAVKDNLATLREDMGQQFKGAQGDHFAHMDYLYHETFDKGHGMSENRQYWYTHDIGGLETIER